MNADSAALPTGTPVTEPPQPADAGLAEQVRAEELDRVMGRSDAAPPDPQRDDETAWGLALSGGGIRSATFGLGVLQTLARNDLLRGFHYQSTVSGGGYIGAFVQGLLHRHGFERTLEVLKSSVTDAPRKQDPDFDPQRPIRHLREYSNYLSPRKSALSGDTMGMIGTYVRNVLLIQVQLIALLMAACLTPLVLYRVVAPLCEHAFLTLLVTGLLCLGAGVLVGNVTSFAAPAAAVDATGKPSRKSRWTATKRALGVIVLLGLATLGGAIGLACIVPPGSGSTLAQFGPQYQVAVIAALLYFAVWLIWLEYDRRMVAKQVADSNGDKLDPRVISPMQQHRRRFVVASFGSAIVAGLTLLLAHDLLAGLRNGATDHWHVIVFGPTIVLTSVMLAGIAHVGFAGPALSDLQREIWARIGGRAARLVILGSAAIALTVYGPWLLRKLGEMQWTAVAAALSWLATTAAGVSGAFSRRSSGDRTGNTVLEILVRIAPAVFVIGLLMAISLGAQVLLQHVGFGTVADVWRTPVADTGSAAYLAYLGKGASDGIGAVLVIVAIAAVVACVFGYAVDVNEFSMNAFYRNRLVRCYLGASHAARQPEPTTNFDPRDDIRLDEILDDAKDVQRAAPAGAGDPPTSSPPRRRPLYPLIGTALNLTATRQLDWQDRKAASFCLTPRYCGYVPPSSRKGAAPIGDLPPLSRKSAAPAESGDKRETLAQVLSLGSAVAISGAAVSPNMGYHSSPAVTFLLTVFDARLGWWLPNPHHESRPKADKTPSSLVRMVYEMLGLTRDDDSFVYLSDGGHFENLGLYELVRRRCRFIVCVDAGADRARSFADLGNAVQKCRVDFGANIAIDVSALRPGPDGRSERGCAVGSIEYTNGQIGTLLYLKPTLTGAEPADVAHYASAHRSFPHESTGDQYFDEKQFESYRRLGEHVASMAIEPALDRALQAEQRRNRDFNRETLSVDVSSAKENFLVELAHQWVTPLAGVHDSFATHGTAMARLFEKMRVTPALAVLDAQVYPAWTDLVPAGDKALQRRTRMPRDDDFRACFYFCQEVMQLMESVYHDLQLEQFWKHPDNRGWMNMFRYWSWSPMFRVAWGVTSPTYGTRFATFCETRLDLPALDDVVNLYEPPVDGRTWTQLCDALTDAGVVNHVERDILLSATLAVEAGCRGPRLFVLRLDWSKLLVRTDDMLRQTTFGIAVTEQVAVAGVERTRLRLLRVQDHLRRLGLGAEFMRQLVKALPIDRVVVPQGSYGLGGVCTESAARELDKQLNQLLKQAQQRERARLGSASKR